MIDCIYTTDGPPWKCTRCGHEQSVTQALRRNCKSNPTPEELIADQTVGVGTQLKRLLGKVFIKPGKGCHCNHYAKLMDQRGAEWCENNVAWCVDCLEESAETLGYPFSRFAAKKVVGVAIYKAKKSEAKAKEEIGAN